MDDHKPVVFYDKSIRLWTAYYVDSKGDQVSKTGYGANRHRAIADIEPIGVANANNK